jgi:hypothetical protein
VLWWPTPTHFPGLPLANSGSADSITAAELKSLKIQPRNKDRQLLEKDQQLHRLQIARDAEVQKLNDTILLYQRDLASALDRIRQLTKENELAEK